MLGILARRLQERDDHWRMCYKALLLLEHLLKHGPPKLADDVMASMSVLEKLQNFQYKDANGRDHGANVRHRASEIITLVSDPEKLAAEREKAKVNRSKYRGVSSSDIRSGYGSTTSSSPSYHSSFDRSSLVRPGTRDRASASDGLQGFGSTAHSAPSLSSTSYEYQSKSFSAYGEIDGSQKSFATSSVSTRREFDSISATRERIEKLRLENEEKGLSKTSPRMDSSRKHLSDKGGSSPLSQKKKLTDVKVNPKIAASLGLKASVPGTSVQEDQNSQKAQERSSRNSPDTAAVDLLVGLKDDISDASEQSKGIAANNPSRIQSDPKVVGGGSNQDWDAFAEIERNTAAQTTDPFDLLVAESSTTSMSTSAGGVGVGKAVDSALQTTSGNGLSMMAKREALPEDAFADIVGIPAHDYKGISLAAGTIKNSASSPPMGLSRNHATGTMGIVVQKSQPDVQDFADFAKFEGVNESSSAKDPFADLI